MPDLFKITRRHYDIIIGQAVQNLPQESGGFLGGVDGFIKAIQPVFNQHLGNKTDTFGITSDDILRAHEFFNKHSLKYFGVYHSHPNGVAYPSPEDIATGQKFHFIIGLKDPKKPVFRAYRILKKVPHPVPIEIVEGDDYSIVDIHAPTDKSKQSTSSKGVAKPVKEAPKSGMQVEAERLGEMIDNIKKEKPDYPKMPPKKPYDSGFSTLA